MENKEFIDATIPWIDPNKRLPTEDAMYFIHQPITGGGLGKFIVLFSSVEKCFYDSHGRALLPPYIFEWLDEPPFTERVLEGKPQYEIECLCDKRIDADKRECVYYQNEECLRNTRKLSGPHTFTLPKWFQEWVQLAFIKHQGNVMTGTIRDKVLFERISGLTYERLMGVSSEGKWKESARMLADALGKAHDRIEALQKERNDVDQQAIQMYVDVADDQQKFIDKLQKELATLKEVRNGGEQEAVALAEWLTRKNSPYAVLYGEDTRWCDNDREYTTSELFQLFKKTQPMNKTAEIPADVLNEMRIRANNKNTNRESEKVKYGPAFRDGYFVGLQDEYKKLSPCMGWIELKYGCELPNDKDTSESFLWMTEDGKYFVFTVDEPGLAWYGGQDWIIGGVKCTHWARIPAPPRRRSKLSSTTT